jgi:hypothetical protein
LLNHSQCIRLLFLVFFGEILELFPEISSMADIAE